MDLTSDYMNFLYAIGWYNNYKYSNSYVLNRSINNSEESPIYQWYKNDINTYNKNIIYNNRSLHTTRIDTTNITDYLTKHLLELCVFYKNLTKLQPTIFINTKIAKLILNNEETYQGVLNKYTEPENNEQLKQVYLGVLAGYGIYINLELDEDDTRVFLFNPENIGNTTLLTTFVKM